MTATLFYDPSKPSAFSSLAKLQAAIKQTRGENVQHAKTQAWWERQDAYTLHKPVRKHFPRNPYIVTNVMQVWESDLLDVQNVSKFNNNYKYLLTVINVFWNFFMYPWNPRLVRRSRQHFNPSLLIRNILSHINNVHSLCRQIRAKNFLTRLSKTCWNMRGYSFRSKNPDVKFSVVERFHRTLRETFNKYFTFKNSYRYIGVLHK